jgi:negative regulator of sigma E activity
VITEKQRRRALARAKWERQQAKRTAAQKRARMLSIVFGSAAAVVVVLFVGWGVHHLVTNDSNSPSQQLPSDFPTLKTPTNPGLTTIYHPPTTGATTWTTTGPTTGSASTTPATTGATGRAKP